MTKFIQMAAPIALAAGLSAAAQATPAERSVVLDTDGIDLSTSAGIATLDARIERAVRSVCGSQVAGHGVVNAAVRACRVATHEALEARKLAVIAAQRRGERLAGR